ncbi:hypothetical protein VP168E361_P0050 [Vibrio phage 168E36-1]|nr:hypothetical protein VP168E361_P0050 [Vibrio phage 168E36-1]
MTNKLPTFCGGIGQKFSEKKGFEYREYDMMYVLRDLLPNPPSVEKEKAQWAIFSTHKSRELETQRKNGKYLALWADIDEGNPTLDQVKTAIGSIVGNSLMAVYSTRSYSEKDNKRKWRVILPIALVDTTNAITGVSYGLIQETLNNLLEKQGLIPDRVNERLNQLCYLPNRGEEYHYAFNQAEPFNYNKSEIFLKEMIQVSEDHQAKRVAMEKQLKAGRERAAVRIASGECSVIDAVNQYYDLPTILEAYGYKVKNGRYLSPMSSSGIPGVSIDKSGLVPKWISQHGSDREFFGRGKGDVFDLICAFDYGHDRDRALRELGEQITTSDGRTITEVNQSNFREQLPSAANYSELDQGEQQWSEWDSQPEQESSSSSKQEQQPKSSSVTEAQELQSQPDDNSESMSSLKSSTDSETSSEKVELNGSSTTSETSTETQSETSDDDTPVDALTHWQLKGAQVLKEMESDPLTSALVNAGSTNGGTAGQIASPEGALDDVDPDDYFDIIEGSDFTSGVKPANWLIGGLIEENAIGILAGATGTFKTFTALHLAWTLGSHDRQFIGYPTVKTGKVLYLFGEGASGLKRRARAIEIQQQSSFDNIVIPNRYIDITEPDDRMMIDRLVKKHCPVLIIYDTLNSLAAIDNNSSREVSSMIKDLRNIQDSVKASSIIVHHVGKDESKGMEGSHAFTSNSDFVFQLNKMTSKKKAANPSANNTDINMMSEMICAKQKEGESFAPKIIEMTSVDLGFQENYGDRKQATSLALLDATSMLGAMPDDRNKPSEDELLLKFVSDLNEEGSFVHKDQMLDNGHPKSIIARLIKTGHLVELANSNTYRVKDSSLNESVATKAYNEHTEAILKGVEGTPDLFDTSHGSELDSYTDEDESLTMTANATGASIDEVKRAKDSAESNSKPGW